MCRFSNPRCFGDSMRKLTVFILCLLLVSSAFAQKRRKSSARGGLPGGAFAATQHVDDDRIKTDIKYLSSDALEGRGTGAKGGDAAADYIASQFEKAGVKPA